MIKISLNALIVFEQASSAKYMQVVAASDISIMRMEFIGFKHSKVGKEKPQV